MFLETQQRILQEWHWDGPQKGERRKADQEEHEGELWKKNSRS